MNNTPIKFTTPKFSVKTELLDDVTILQSVMYDCAKQLQQSIIDTTERQVYEKLIEMGWTPPPNLGIKVGHAVPYDRVPLQEHMTNIIEDLK